MNASNLHLTGLGICVTLFFYLFPKSIMQHIASKFIYSLITKYTSIFNKIIYSGTINIYKEYFCFEEITKRINLFNGNFGRKF